MVTDYVAILSTLYGIGGSDVSIAAKLHAMFFS
jgi:hypothetical protein